MSAAADESPVADTVDAPVGDAVDAPGAPASVGIDAAVDNDILIKAAVLDLSGALVAARAGVLGQARFVVRDRVERMAMQGDAVAAGARADALVARCQALEPDESEAVLAAEIEREATLRDLALDGGESLLAAIVASRSIPELHTGDKRAVAALERIIPVVPRMAAIRGRVRCLEQLVVAAAGRLGASAVGVAICAEPNADKTLTICSECHSARAINTEALASYVARLRALAPTVLAP